MAIEENGRLYVFERLLQPGRNWDSVVIEELELFYPTAYVVLWGYKKHPIKGRKYSVPIQRIGSFFRLESEVEHCNRFGWQHELSQIIPENRPTPEKKYYETEEWNRWKDSL